jgi:uncharacterized protein (TIGR02300 family)
MPTEAGVFKKMAQALASDPRGLKRICSSCGTRFYDLNKRPIACPNCATEFTGEVKLKTRRGRLSAIEAEGQVTDKTAVEADSEEEMEDEVEEAETISLEDAETTEDGDDDDIDLDTDDLDADDLDEDLDDDDLDDDLDVDVEDED